ncbi:MAG: Gfo/Idh/MocA family oxidoreductase, partial [Gammaproteobacteria bacterium]|nr:Gfo/Idh/MocA family oxidoreductase [Gammaproteobacteria bacterium]NIW47132.1 Gfo/Idh/MocA family oxidoreductase [Gammaproteobacteria bacterium]NIW97333.1 Gfo/Idh/MocA family oxidoreductase [Phycisphaerae bacterium]
MKIDRRKFLQMTSALAGSSVLANAMPWFSVFNDPFPAGQGANDRVRLGVIGIGNRGDTLLENLLELEDRMNMEVVAICDNYEPHYQKGIEIMEGRGEAFYDYRKMYDEVEMDGVVIATPLHEHAHMTIEAMEAGIHVFCEKSMARHLEDVKAMYDTHLMTDKVLLIGHQRLFSPVYLDAIKRIREDNEIGPIVMLRAHWTRNRPWEYYKDTGGRGTEL